MPLITIAANKKAAASYAIPKGQKAKAASSGTWKFDPGPLITAQNAAVEVERNDKKLGRGWKNIQFHPFLAVSAIGARWTGYFNPV